jgi:hypothetical protein
MAEAPLATRCANQLPPNPGCLDLDRVNDD